MKCTHCNSELIPTLVLDQEGEFLPTQNVNLISIISSKTHEKLLYSCPNKKCARFNVVLVDIRSTSSGPQ